MSLDLACPAARQHQTTRAHLAAAGITRHGVAAAVAAGTLVRLRRGVYARAPMLPVGRHLVSGGRPDRNYLASARAALLSLGANAAAAGRTAAVLWAFDLLVEPSLLEVQVHRDRGHVPMSGLVVRRRDLPSQSLPVLGGEPVVVLTAVSTVVDCALSRPLREAVVIADSALRAGRVTVEELEEASVGWSRKPGGRRVSRVVALVDPASGSVLESVLRLLVVTAGLTGMRSQRPVAVSGGLQIRVDFCFDRARLVIECDGRRWHDPEDARDLDRLRDNELTRHGWRVLRVTWAEVLHDPAYVLALIRDSLLAQPLAA